MRKMVMETLRRSNKLQGGNRGGPPKHEREIVGENNGSQDNKLPNWEE